MIHRLLIFTAACLLMTGGTALADIAETEEMTIPARGVASVDIRDFAFTDLVYYGERDAVSFDISFECIVKTSDRREFDELTEELNLETEVSGDRLTIRLDHPRQTNRGVLDRIFDRAEWRVRVIITGPSEVDLDIDTDFGSARINDTAGIIRMDSDFTDFTVARHTGPLTGSIDFASLDAESLAGSFDLSANFGGMDIQLAELRGDSRASTSFGSVTIRIPETEGADVYVAKSFAGIDFNTRNSVNVESDRHRVIGNGGSRINLSASFGTITVSDYRAVSESSTRRSSVPGLFPLSGGMQWEFRDGSRSFGIRAETSAWLGSNPTVVLIGEGRNAPFQRITLFQTEAGLILTEIDGMFFGRDLSSALFDPPKYWLPYDTSVTIRDVLLGTITVQRRDGNYEYEVTTPGGDRHTIVISPATGFTRFDAFRVAQAGDTRRERAESPPPPPAFERGEVSSIDIRLRGSRLLDRSDITGRLGLRTGRTYSREEIDTAVEALEQDRFIDSAYFRITPEGDLTVTVYGRRILDTDHDLDVSFSRVGGVGLGPRLTLHSLVGPFTEISAGAEYHFANKEWTYDITGEKRLFDPSHQLIIGGGYRDAYESVLDWAVSRDEASINAFLVGLENKNFFEVKGATAFVGFAVNDAFSIRASYFDDEYSSLKKHTNWSFFNAAHTKADNLPLISSFETRYTGMRYEASARYRDGFTESRVRVEAEQGDPEHPGIPESYTRWLGNAEFFWWFQWDNMLRFRAAAGYSNDNLPPQRAFRLGGLNTLRGYEFESVPELDPQAGQMGFLFGGNKMLLFNMDYIYGMENDFGIAFFADAGNAWINDGEYDLNDLRRDVGIGLVFGQVGRWSRYGSETGPDGLRINWATPVGPVPHTSHWTVNFIRSF